MNASPPGTGAAQPRVSRFSGLYRLLALDVVAPLVVVQVGLKAGWPTVTTLAVAALFPLGDTLAGFVRSRSLNAIGAVSLVAILVGIGLAAATGNALFAILKDSVFTLVFSALFLSSLVARKPLVYTLNRQMLDAPGAARLDELWTADADVRRAFRLMTVVWGGGLLLEASARIVAGLTLPVRTAAAVSPWIAVLGIGGLIAWTVAYVRGRRAAAQRAGVAEP